jgi:hypothetical protein
MRQGTLILKAMNNKTKSFRPPDQSEPMATSGAMSNI